MFSDHQSDLAGRVEAARVPTTLNFDDVPVDRDFGTAYNGVGFMPENYGGLTWSADWVVANVDEWYTVAPYPDSGWFSGVTSGRQIAWNSGGAPVEISARSFNIESFELTATWDRKLSVEIVAYRDGEIVYDETVIVGDRRPTHVELNLKRIDDLILTPTEIKVDPNSGGSGSYFVIDDMVVSRVRSLPTGVEDLPPTRDQFLAAHGVDAHQPLHPDLGHIVALV